MLELAHSVFAQIGLAGLVGLWVAKAGLGWVLFRYWKVRRFVIGGKR